MIMKIQKHGNNLGFWARTLWLFGDRLALSIGYYPSWNLREVGMFRVYKNGWRPGDHCLDITGNILKISWSITIYFNNQDDVKCK